MATGSDVLRKNHRAKNVPYDLNSAAPYDYLIVGAGFAGSVLAERLAAGLGRRVLLIDRRPHIGGNAFDRKDAAGVLVHVYGPHIFHTNSQEIFGYLSQFTDWRPYEHRVLASIDGRLVPMPINRTTLNAVYGADLTSDEAAEAFLRRRAERILPIRTAEDAVVSAIGRELYEKFFRDYTRKQWGLDPSGLDKSVTTRVATRTTSTTAIFSIASRPSRQLATPGCSRICWTTATSRCRPASISPM